MAVSSVGSSNSIYGTRNVITGLASGMDTESMIENAVSGFKTKITSLQQKRTKIGWQQDAYRSIIGKMANLTNKYASYNSSTNLLSPSFFSQAIKTETNGKFADKISATGKSSSSVEINRVMQLATAARYSVSGSKLGANTNYDGFAYAQATGAFSLTGETDVSTLDGSMSITYGNQNLSLSFKENKVFDSVSDLADDIRAQLSNQTIAINGNTYKASDRISVSVSGDKITFSDKSDAGNAVYIKSAGKDLKDTLNITPGKDTNGFKIKAEDLKKTVQNADYLSGSDMEITLDGVTKSIKMPTMKEIQAEAAKDTSNASEESKQANAYVKLVQQEIDDKFGTLTGGKSKLAVENVLGENNGGNIQLRFTAGQKGSSFAVNSDKSVAMKMGTSGISSYLDTGKKLSALNIKLTDDMAARDESGNNKNDENGNTLYALKINGVEVGEFTKDTSLKTVIDTVNSNKKAGVTASYSKTTNQFVFTSKETGAAGKVDFGESGSLANALFGGGEEEKGQDAIFQATINGSTINMTRSSNTVDIDGLKVTLKGTFGYEARKDEDGKDVLDENGNIVYDEVKDTEAVTFSSKADADKIVETIKAFVDDSNETIKEIKEAYSTLPLQRSNKSYYQPLTEEDEASMSESAVNAWNEKAKVGLLFGDNDLSSLYRRLTQAVSMTGQDGADLKAAGITSSYSNGLSLLSFDEKALRETLDNDPDRVADIFTKSEENGATSDGLMVSLQKPLDMYGKTTGTHGILVNKAGSVLSPSTLYSNLIQNQLDDIDKEIEKWQDKMSDRVDFYTQKFSALEQMIANMNSQSSTLASLMGG